MRYLNLGYEDVRKMPVRYRTWYIERYIKSIKEENEYRQKLLDNNKTTRSF